LNGKQRERFSDSEMQRRPFATNALHVKRPPVDFKPIGSIWRTLGRRSDAQAGPHSHTGLRVIQFCHECHGAIAFEIVPPQNTAQVIGCMFLFLAFLHTLLTIETLRSLGGTNCYSIIGSGYLTSIGTTHDMFKGVQLLCGHLGARKGRRFKVNLGACKGFQAEKTANSVQASLGTEQHSGRDKPGGSLAMRL
jgi:hypothetical protein